MKAEPLNIKHMTKKVISITAYGKVAGEQVTFEAKKGGNGQYTLGRKFGLDSDQKPHHGSAAVRVNTLLEVVEMVTSNKGNDYSLWCYYKSPCGKVSRRNLYSLSALKINYSLV